jgi:RNA polymerase sigma-70 factor, ECF subfamily
MMLPTVEIPAPRVMLPPTLDDLYCQYHRTVFAAAYRVTGNAADAEDVLHTVFVRLLRGNPSLDNPEGYLRRAAVNAAVDLVRARRTVGGVEFDRMPSSTRGAAEQMEDGDLRRHLRAALATLPEKTAAVFALRYFEDRKNAEIADLLGMTQVGVAVTLHRAKRKLQEELRSMGVAR